MSFIYAWLVVMWTRLTSAGGPLATGELILVGINFDVASDLVESDLTRPTFTGYADAAVAAFAATVADDGTPYVMAAPKTFIPTNDTNLPQYIYGAGILDANGDLVAVTKFTAPVQLAYPLQQLHVTPKVYLSPDNGFELEVSLG